MGYNLTALGAVLLSVAATAGGAQTTAQTGATAKNGPPRNTTQKGAFQSNNRSRLCAMS
jgi:hypothetical protein